ncbi:cysteine synthase [Candidatus Poribacteria bacterium]|nr:cysteine synthase [Candidatus Poribacteria bacterium]
MNNSKIFDLSPYPLLQQIGQTPLVQVDLTRDQFPEIEVYAKAEMLNPGGSIKDRPVLRMLTQAILDGDLTKDKVILDSSSGNAGIAYAMIGAVLGYEVELVIPENASQERKKRMQAHNANMVFTDAVHGYDEALREVHRRYHALPEKYFMADQYKNENNWRAHFETTAAEILQQTEGKITHFVAGVGTGGTITGVGRRLKEFNPDIQICSIVPDDFPGIEGLKPLGQPEDIVPEIYDDSVVDVKLPVTIDDAYDMCNELARKGWFVGQSSGAYMKGVYDIAREVQKGLIVTIFCDLGERYFSTRLWD